jgi:hypothetical protein
VGGFLAAELHLFSTDKGTKLAKPVMHFHKVSLNTNYWEVHRKGMYKKDAIPYVGIGPLVTNYMRIIFKQNNKRNVLTCGLYNQSMLLLGINTILKARGIQMLTWDSCKKLSTFFSCLDADHNAYVRSMTVLCHYYDSIYVRCGGCRRMEVST